MRQVLNSIGIFTKKYSLTLLHIFKTEKRWIPIHMWLSVLDKINRRNSNVSGIYIIWWNMKDCFLRKKKTWFLRCFDRIYKTRTVGKEFWTIQLVLINRYIEIKNTENKCQKRKRRKINTSKSKLLSIFKEE